MGTVDVELFDDRSNTSIHVVADPSLAKLFSYAHQWAQNEKRTDLITLSFSSMLAAMTAGDDPLCRWLRTHLSLKGVSAESMTKGWEFKPEVLPEKPPDGSYTSFSFRRALAKARELCLNEADNGLAVRHFMAAYAVIPNYHQDNFLRLRIDRRAWCIELAEHLVASFPAEKNIWLKYAQGAIPVPSLGFNTDAPEGRDLLNIDREVEAFARLLASRNSATPLSVGVFGAWGSGKSFFMRRLRKRVSNFATLGRDEGAQSKFHGEIAQIDFNAWHYSEGNLAASFVDHILRNFRVGADETTETLRKRSEAIINQIDSAKQDLDVRERAVAEAEAKSAQAQQALADLDSQIADQIDAKKGEITTAQSTLQEAQDNLTQELTDLQSEIDERVTSLQAADVVGEIFKSLNNAQLSEATGNVQSLITEVQTATTNRKLILYGLIAVGITAGAAAIADAVIDTAFWTQVIAAVTAVGTIAAVATPWLKKLNAFAEKGKEFEAKQQEFRQEVEAKVNEAHKTVVSELQTAVADRRSNVDKLGEQLKQLEQAPASGRLELEQLEKDRALAQQAHAEAAAVVEAKNAELRRLTTGTLLDEFLNDRASNDGYLKDLTIFSRIRNDFERLSELMTKANEEYVNGKAGQPPAVSRIVLYIDDLDRAPSERVVEVLKLIHLLLAFPLFVCVAAVDPRWVTHCLHKAPGLLDDIGDDKRSYQANKELDEEVGVPATAADYLEKIFQIPLWLRPVPSAQRAAIARTLLDPSESLEQAQFELPLTALGKAVLTSPTDLEGVEIESEDVVSSGAPIDPDLISSDELLFLDQLSGLLDGNPRALKRFVNTYRLVKTALSDVELAVFLNAKSGITTYLPYRICMGQLAVLCTQRHRALRLVQFADQLPEVPRFAEWLTEFGAIDPQLVECFRTAFINNLEEMDTNTFKLWLERTRRYSFYL